jgi:hypothetical protein
VKPPTLPRGILWRFDLAQKCIERAKRAFEAGDVARGKRLCGFARALISECDVDDFEHGQADGRVVELRAVAGERAALLERLVEDTESSYSHERDVRPGVPELL